MKAVMAVCALLMLGGCATGGPSNPPWAAFSGGSCGKLSDDQELSMNLADDMAKEGKLHASLANLQNLPEGFAQVQLRKARIYRQLGRPEAGPLYRGLLGTCLSAEGDHGLGQLAAARGDNTLAASYLERAAQAAPTDEKIRNDLGVVYLNQLRTDAYEDNPTHLQNEGFVPQLVVRGSTAPLRQPAARPAASSPDLPE